MILQLNYIILKPKYAADKAGSTWCTRKVTLPLRSANHVQETRLFCRKLAIGCSCQDAELIIGLLHSLGCVPSWIGWSKPFGEGKLQPYSWIECTGRM